ncbi:WD40/YVTN/BNR-like repeat-containing protein [Arcticibacterium luteifluviistationis]|uniref:Ig-like domain-containing protein n=1 Tax=Arcticibacterium luteifluviistationis TaxID=1784714 RepID=A0A2Z4GFS3_9BACT|nr:3-coathanger stack domain-containing protein [Arcticibacterium luteifluviistationis]AWW00022.1 hypothetical protein DJ013_18350 [Arcticibacterium luteifluviistationis]
MTKLKISYFLFWAFSFSSAIAQVSPIDSLELIKQEYIKQIASPITGEIPEYALIQAREEILKRRKDVNSLSSSQNLTWHERGPKDSYGHIRCIEADPNDITGKKVWAGAQTGGLWYNNDITNPDSIWHQANGADNWLALNISSIAFNPANTLEMYVATGDGNTYLSPQGVGIYKSSNGGQTFFHLSSTTPSPNATGTVQQAFTSVTKLEINSQGVLFGATPTGVIKSSNGGVSWNKVLDGTWTSDLEIGNDDIVYVSFQRKNGNAKMYRSNSASGNSWTSIEPSEEGYRTEIALANSPNRSNQVIYAFAINGPVLWFKKSINGGDSWSDLTIPSSSFSNGQDFLSYTGSSLSMIVDPENSNNVFAAGGFLTKSFDGGTSWETQTSYIGGTNGLVQINNDIVLATSRGVFFSENFSSNINAIFNYSYRTKGFRLSEAKNASMKNIAGNPEIFGGAVKIAGSISEISSSTSIGGTPNPTTSTFIDQDQPEILISSNNLYNSDNLNYISNLGGDASISDYDSENNILYSLSTASYSANKTTFTIISDVGNSNTSISIDISSYLYVKQIKASRIPYSFLILTDNGKIYRVYDANTTPQILSSSTYQLPTSGASSFDVGEVESVLILTFSNYDVSSVWYSLNGGSYWQNKDYSNHGLANIPIWQAKFIPHNASEVILSTELGLWSTDNIKASNPNWQPNNDNLPLIKCNSVHYRPADSMLVVSTAGRGAFISPMRGFFNPTINNTFKGQTLCSGGSIDIHFETTGIFPSNPNFQVQLSDINGDFTSPTNIGFGTSSPISASIPSLVKSSNYKLRIVDENNSLISNITSGISIRNASELSVHAFATKGGDSPYLFCKGSNITAFVSGVIDPQSSFKYTWIGPNGFTQNGQTLNITNIQSSSEGIYTVNVEIPSCQTYTSTLEFIETYTPSIKALSNENILCEGTSTVLFSTSEIFFDTNPTYSWSGPNNFSATGYTANLNNVSQASGGVYSLTATFNGNCAGTVTSTVNITISNILPSVSRYSGTACTSGSIELYSYISTNNSGLSLSYNWSGPNNFQSTSSRPALNNLSEASEGIYTCTISYSGSCQGQTTSTVNVSLNPPPYNFSYPRSFCTGQIATVSSSPGITGLITNYSWTGPNGFNSSGEAITLNSFDATKAGTYSITAAYSGTCSGTSTYTVNLSLNDPKIYFYGGSLFCENGQVNKTASLSHYDLNSTYTWQGPNGFQSTGSSLAINNFDVANSGIYTATATFSGQCTGTTSNTTVVRIIEKPSSSLSIHNEDFCIGTNVKLYSSSNVWASTVQWEGPNFSSNVSSPEITELTTDKLGFYKATFNYSNGCPSITDSIEIKAPIQNALFDITTSSGGIFCSDQIQANLRLDYNRSYYNNISKVEWQGPENFSYTSFPQETTTGYNPFSTQIPISKPEHSGTYTAEVFFKGCQETSETSTEISVINEPMVYANISIGGHSIPQQTEIELCPGNSFSISASAIGDGPRTYSWSGPNGFQSNYSSYYSENNLDSNVSGIYTVTSTLLSGACAGTSTATVNLTQISIPKPQISAANKDYKSGEKVTLASNCSFHTYWNDGYFEGNSISVYPYDSEKFFAQCATEEACISPASNYIQFNNCQDDYLIDSDLANLSTNFYARDQITSTKVIAPVSNIIFDAAKSISLSPGFEVISGSTFKAIINGCEEN